MQRIYAVDLSNAVDETDGTAMLIGRWPDFESALEANDPTYIYWN